MRIRRVRLSWLPALLLLAQASGANEEPEARFGWQPSLAIGVEATDNALLRSSDRDTDVGIRIVPRLQLSYAMHALDLGADLGVDTRRHTQTGELNDTFYRMRGHAELGLLPGLTVRVSDDFVPQAVQLGAPPDNTANLAQTNRAAGEVQYWRALSEHVELSFGASGARFDSETIDTLVPGAGGTPVAGRFRADYWEGGGFVQLARGVGRRSEIFARGRARYRSFEDASDSSHIDVSGVVGAHLRWTRSLGLRLEGGVGMLDFDSGATDTRFTGRADLRYQAGPRWRFGLGLHHGLTTDLLGNAFADLTGRLEVERSFGTRTKAILTGFSSLLDAESQATQRDLFGGLELALQRQLSRNFRIDASYRFWENAGPRTGNDFRQHRGFVRLSYRY